MQKKGFHFSLSRGGGGLLPARLFLDPRLTPVKYVPTFAHAYYRHEHSPVMTYGTTVHSPMPTTGLYIFQSTAGLYQIPFNNQLTCTFAHVYHRPVHTSVNYLPSFVHVYYMLLHTPGIVLHSTSCLHLQVFYIPYMEFGAGSRNSGCGRN